jgi:hypothetical protein
MERDELVKQICQDSRASLIDYALIVIGSRILSACVCESRAIVSGYYTHMGLGLIKGKHIIYSIGIYRSVLVNRRYTSLYREAFKAAIAYRILREDQYFYLDVRNWGTV